MDDRLVRVYIGEDATQIMNSDINWKAGLLGMFIGPVWFFYRKAWAPGFLYIFIAYLLHKIGSFSIEAISIILGSIMIFVANRIYIWDAKKKTQKIRIANRGIKEEELLEILREKGGTSISAVIIYGVIMLVLIMAIVVHYISQYSYVFENFRNLMELMN